MTIKVSPLKCIAIKKTCLLNCGKSQDRQNDCPLVEPHEFFGKNNCRQGLLSKNL